MAGKSKALVCLFLAGLLLTALLAGSGYSRQEVVRQESRLAKEEAAYIVHPAQKEAARESQEGEKEAGVGSQPAQEKAAEEPASAEKAPAQKTESGEDKTAETIVPAPKDVKEATAIYVFLGWMWLSIFVLIYFLRLKVKETDRIHLLKFFSKEQD